MTWGSETQAKSDVNLLLHKQVLDTKPCPLEGKTWSIVLRLQQLQSSFSLKHELSHAV